MAVVDDDMMEGSISSLILNSLESNQSGDVLSPEDVAWVDSCLIKDSEISDSNWNSLKDALLDIICSQPDSLDSSAAGGDDVSKNDTEIILYSVEEAETAQFLGETAQFLGETAQFLGETDNVLVPIYEEMENSDDDSPKSQKSNTLLSQTYYKNAFLPNYNDGLKVNENMDLGLDLGLQAIEMEPWTDDIFRVWDMDISAEEDDELVKQLNKALAGSYFQSIPSTFEDSGAWKDMKELSVDDLVAGIADLSLSQNSSLGDFLVLESC